MCFKFNRLIRTVAQFDELELGSSHQGGGALYFCMFCVLIVQMSDTKITFFVKKLKLIRPCFTALNMLNNIFIVFRTDCRKARMVCTIGLQR